MAYIRKLPSGKYQATVRLANGKRTTKTHKLKSTVSKWATEQEARVNRGEHRDPRAGQIKLGEWRERVSANRNIEPTTRAKVDSIWRTHCATEWEGWPMAAVTRMEAQAWANKLKTTRRARHKGRNVAGPDKTVPVLGAEMIHTCVNTMSKLYAIAMDETPPLVMSNPFVGLDLPPIVPRPVEFYEHEEAGLLYAAIEELSGPKWRAAVELGMHAGLRPGEIYGLHGSRVDWARNQLHVTQVMTRYGLREYAKSRRSHRPVPVPSGTLATMWELMKDRDERGRCTCPKVHADGTRQLGDGPCPGLVFPAPMGGPIDDGNFRWRVWNPAVEAAGIRRFPPKVMRHTAASWLVQDGVPLYDVQALLGHESFATTTRYAHLAPEAHSKVIESWNRRTGEQDFSGPDARVTHE